MGGLLEVLAESILEEEGKGSGDGNKFVHDWAVLGHDSFSQSAI